MVLSWTCAILADVLFLEKFVHLKDDFFGVFIVDVIYDVTSGARSLSDGDFIGSKPPLLAMG